MLAFLKKYPRGGVHFAKSYANPPVIWENFFHGRNVCLHCIHNGVNLPRYRVLFALIQA